MRDFDAIVDEHNRYLVRIAYLYVKNWSTAEDIVQEVFIKYFQTSEQFRQEASLKTYLTRMTTNRSKDYLRSWKNKKDVLFDTIFAQTKGIDEKLLEQEQLDALERNLFQLPLKYREPLILYYYNEQSIAEIAAYLKLNENTVKTRLRRAKQQMKQFLRNMKRRIGNMAKFKHKLDDMMGDTSSQERRIKEQVRMKMNKPAQKRTWHIPIVASAATAIALFLFISTVSTNLFTSNEGRGVPYDPLDDFYEISALKRAGELSVLDYTQFAGLPTVKELKSLQYLDPRTVEIDNVSYYPVIERKTAVYDQVVYEAGDIVRAVNNARNHLPIFQDEYYEVIAVPGDRVVLQNGKLTINGKAVDSALFEKYEALKIKLAGGYDQVLNMREYMVLNYFPAQGTTQAATINPVHKIYGELVALAPVGDTPTMYETAQGPEAYFDLYLYDMIFGTGEQADSLTMSGARFPDMSRIDEFYLEAGYREVVEQTEDKAILRYDYGREGGNVYDIEMEKVPGTTSWRWYYE